MRAIFALFLALAASASAAESVNLTGVHLCCGGCDKAAVAAAVSTGATATIEKQEGGKVLVITAADAAALGKAVAAVSAAGFSGKPSRGDVSLPALPAAAKLNGAMVTGLHNCCGKCAKAITGALTAAAGVEKVTVDGTSATLAGTVDPAVVVAALRAAGLDGAVAASK